MIIEKYKPVGKRSVEVVDEVKKELGGVKVGYVGTLDPMADGLLLVVTDKDTKKVEELVSLPKTYVFKALFGISTDTGDILGFVNKVSDKKDISEKELKKALLGFKGTFFQQVPFFSSVKYKGRKLHEIARSDIKGQIKLPKREITVYDIKLLEFLPLPYPALRKEVFERLDALGANKNKFRYGNVKKSWDNFFQKERGDFLTATISAQVSRGAYIRSLAEDIGKNLGMRAMCLSITRTKVGDYKMPV